MQTYHKIQNVFKRDPDNKSRVIPGEWMLPEFLYLKDAMWTWTEKVDGTNMRLIVDGINSRVAGKTNEATPHKDLLARCYDILHDVARDDTMNGLTLYGEGYGAGIQKGGGNYSATRKDFVLFDVSTNTPDQVWLSRENVEEIGAKYAIPVVPIINIGPLSDAIALASKGYCSFWGNFDAEGLICKPFVELRTRRGHRIITKIKTKDFGIVTHALNLLPTPPMTNGQPYYDFDMLGR